MKKRIWPFYDVWPFFHLSLQNQSFTNYFFFLYFLDGLPSCHNYSNKACSHEGHSVAVPPNFFVPPSFVVARKFCLNI